MNNEEKVAAVFVFTILALILGIMIAFPGAKRTTKDIREGGHTNTYIPIRDYPGIGVYQI